MYKCACYLGFYKWESGLIVERRIVTRVSRRNPKINIVCQYHAALCQVLAAYPCESF